MHEICNIAGFSDKSVEQTAFLASRHLYKGLCGVSTLLTAPVQVCYT